MSNREEESSKPNKTNINNPPNLFNLDPSASFTNVNPFPNTFSNFAPTNVNNIQAPINALPIFGNLEPNNLPVQRAKSNVFVPSDNNITPTEITHSPDNALPIFGGLEPMNTFTDTQPSTNALPIFGTVVPETYGAEINSSSGLFSSFTASTGTTSNHEQNVKNNASSFSSFPATNSTTNQPSSSALPIFGNTSSTEASGSLFSSFTTAIGPMPLVDEVKQQQQRSNPALPIFGDFQDVGEVATVGNPFAGSVATFTHSQHASAAAPVFGAASGIFGGTSSPAQTLSQGDVVPPIFGNDNYEEQPVEDSDGYHQAFGSQDYNAQVEGEGDRVYGREVESHSVHDDRKSDTISLQRRKHRKHEFGDVDGNRYGDSNHQRFKNTSDEKHTSSHVRPHRDAGRRLCEKPSRRDNYPYNTSVDITDCDSSDEVEAGVNARTGRYTVDIEEYRRRLLDDLDVERAKAVSLPPRLHRRHRRRKVDAKRRHRRKADFDADQEEGEESPSDSVDSSDDGGDDRYRCFHDDDANNRHQVANGVDVNTSDDELDDHSSIKKKKRKMKMVSLFMRRGQPEFVMERPQRSLTCFEDEDDDDDETGIYEAPVFKRIVANSLSELKMVHSKTTEERLAALVAYDELVQKRDEPQGYRIIGTCEDMCPERERYTREFQRRISRFEMLPSQQEDSLFSSFSHLVDHCLAVKEYSRSSADQEVPLPNTLRTPAMLEYSMNYLLQVVANQGGDGRWDGWFDFLWDRTRAIRKDLIQQELRNNMSTLLMEKCVRFHIFSSMRLCEEQPPFYDNKINDENLTKCLQTLKEFYNMSRKIPNEDEHIITHEPEFRCYITLLNLKNADCIRELTKLPQYIQDTPEMVFARNVFMSYASNNYLRFFDLLTSATFMQACLMHRYVARMHHVAMATMQTAYDPKEITMFDFHKVQHDLAFESLEELLEMCQIYGITIHYDLEKIELVNDCFVMFENKTKFELKRNPLIENKMPSSIGEAINGGPIHFTHDHLASNSFDSNGVFNRGYPDPPPKEPEYKFEVSEMPIFESRVYTTEEEDDVDMWTSAEQGGRSQQPGQPARKVEVQTLQSVDQRRLRSVDDDGSDEEIYENALDCYEPISDEEEEEGEVKEEEGEVKEEQEVDWDEYGGGGGEHQEEEYEGNDGYENDEVGVEFADYGQEEEELEEYEEEEEMDGYEEEEELDHEGIEEERQSLDCEDGLIREEEEDYSENDRKQRGNEGEEEIDGEMDEEFANFLLENNLCEGVHDEDTAIDFELHELLFLEYKIQQQKEEEVLEGQELAFSVGDKEELMEDKRCSKEEEVEEDIDDKQFNEMIDDGDFDAMLASGSFDAELSCIVDDSTSTVVDVDQEETARLFEVISRKGESLLGVHQANEFYDEVLEEIMEESRDSCKSGEEDPTEQMSAIETPFDEALARKEFAERCLSNRTALKQLAHAYGSISSVQIHDQNLLQTAFVQLVHDCGFTDEYLDDLIDVFHEMDEEEPQDWNDEDEQEDDVEEHMYFKDILNHYYRQNYGFEYYSDDSEDKRMYADDAFELVEQIGPDLYEEIFRECVELERLKAAEVKVANEDNTSGLREIGESREFSMEGQDGEAENQIIPSSEVVLVTKELFESFIEDLVRSLISELFMNPAYMSTAFTQQLFQELLNEECLDICSQVVARGHRRQQMRDNSFEKIRAARLHSAEKILRRTSSETIGEPVATASGGAGGAGEVDGRKRQAGRDGVEGEAVTKACQSINETMLDACIEETLNAVYQNVVMERNLEIEAASRLNTLDAALSSSFYSCVDQLLQDIAEEVHADCVRRPLTSAAKFTSKMYQRVYGEALHAWKLSYARQCKVLEFKERLDVQKDPKNLREALKILLPDRIPQKDSSHSISMSKNTNLFFKNSTKAIKCSEKIKSDYRIKLEKIKEQINLQEIFVNSKALSKDDPNCVYYKLLLCTERDDANWLRDKFTKKEFSEEQIQSLEASTPTDHILRYSCTTELQGTVEAADCRRSEFTNKLYGTNAILFILDSNFTDNSSYWLKEFKRLSSVVKCIPSSSPVSLLLTAAFYIQYNTETIKELLHLSKSHLIKERIQNISFLFFKDTPYRDSISLSNSIVDLVDTSYKPCPVTRYASLQHYIDFILDKYYYPRLSSYKQTNPIALIKLYNSCIDYAIGQLTGDSLALISYPVYEFSGVHKDLPPMEWNSMDRLNILRGHLSTLYLRVKKPACPPAATSPTPPPQTTPSSAPSASSTPSSVPSASSTSTPPLGAAPSPPSSSLLVLAPRAAPASLSTDLAPAPTTTGPAAPTIQTPVDLAWTRIDAIVATVCDQALKNRRNYPGEFVYNNISIIMDKCRQRYLDRFGSTWSEDQLPHWTLDVKWISIIDCLLKCRCLAAQDIDENGNINSVYAMLNSNEEFIEPNQWIQALNEEIPIREISKTKDPVSIEEDNNSSTSEEEPSSFDDCRNKELSFEKFLESKCLRGNECENEGQRKKSTSTNDFESPLTSKNTRKPYATTRGIQETYDRRKRLKLATETSMTGELEVFTKSPALNRELNSLEARISDQCSKEAQFEYSILKAINT